MRSNGPPLSAFSSLTASLQDLRLSVFISPSTQELGLAKAGGAKPGHFCMSWAHQRQFYTKLRSEYLAWEWLSRVLGKDRSCIYHLPLENLQLEMLRIGLKVGPFAWAEHVCSH